MGTILVSCRNQAYAEAHYLPPLRRAGWDGEVRFLVPGGPSEDWIGVHGLLLTGGGDIHPCNWDPEEPVHPTAEVDAARDAREIPAVRAAWARNLPILGICRGAQILNVALGGSMIQDIPVHFGCAQELHQHGSAEDPGELHPVEVRPGTLLEREVESDRILVNSRHHQAVQRLAPGLRACAHHPDTRKGDEILIEAIEAEDAHRWVLGVQWHPENLTAREDASGIAARRLFDAFARRMSAGRPPVGSAIIDP